MAKGKDLFSYGNTKNNTHRSPFDLSKRRLFSSKVGELLPVWWQPTLPGDKWTISADMFSRTQPVQTAAYTRISEQMDFFFVPYRLLWRNAPSSFTQMSEARNVAQSLRATQLINDRIPHVSLGQLFDAITNNTQTAAPSTTLGAYVRDECNQLTKLQCFKLLAYLGYFPADKFSLFYGNVKQESEASKQLEIITKGTAFDRTKLVSLMPLLAYQKVYFDFYRNQFWEEDQAQAHNVDYMTTSTNIADYDTTTTGKDLYMSGMLNLRYANFAKDLFFGLLPTAQYGEIAEIGQDLTSYGIKRGTQLTSSAQIEASNGALMQVGDVSSNNVTTVQFNKDVSKGNPIRVPAQSAIRNLNLQKLSSTIDSAINAINVRAMMATQKWREIANTGDRTYRSQIEKHFGVKLPAFMENNATYIGGWDNSITINEEVNTNLADGNAANIKGKGVGSSSCKKLSFECKEHGIILAVYHSRPYIDYDLSGQNRNISTINIADFPMPEYDQLGLEPVTYNEFFYDDTSGTNTTFTIGYAPRYYNYKTDVDDCVGRIRVVEPDWCALYDKTFADKAFSQTSDFRLNPSLKIDPNLLNDIFGVQASVSDEYVMECAKNIQEDGQPLPIVSVSTDQIDTSLDMNVYCVRNLDFNGLPY